MNEADIVIIGAGACGLMAAYELSKAGKKVIVLEGRNRTGGRIHTLRDAGFSLPIEAGAEFIHGDLPLTQSLLKEGNASFYRREGKMYRMEKGKIHETEEFIEDLDKLLSKLKQLDSDMPFSEFLDKHLDNEKYAPLKESAIKFAEGYDAARIEKISSVSLCKEWRGEGTSIPYYVKDGYDRLISLLENGSRTNGCTIHLSTVAKEVRWSKEGAEVISAGGKRYIASVVIITVPLGILLSQPHDEANIAFVPRLPDHERAVKELGNGAVIKVILEFKNTFWDDLAFVQKAVQLPRLGFLISEAQIPVWWTQLPRKQAILTGWVGGPGAEELAPYSDEEILEKAMHSLSWIFRADIQFLKELLFSSLVMNWTADPYSLGGYTYAMVGSKEAKKFLTQPVENTLYFAGEALHEGETAGTVEAALSSGKKVAGEILKGENK